MRAVPLLAISAWAAPPAPEFAVSEPRALLPHSQMVSYNVGYPDSNLLAVKDANGYRFWMEGGKVGAVPGRPWSYMTGGKSLSVEALVTPNVHYWSSYPCPVFDGFQYQEPCVHDGDMSTLGVRTCNGSPSQSWEVAGDPRSMAAVKSMGGKSGCWEIDGCASTSPASVDTSFGCKRLPTPGWQNRSSCEANMAWRFAADGTIVSVMDGHCLEVDKDDGITVQMAACDGSDRQRWIRDGKAIRSVAAGKCVDNTPATNGGSALMWAGNVYLDEESGGILMFIHMEFGDPRPGAEMCYFRFGLAYSEDGGREFTWVGYVAEPEVSYNHSMFSSQYGRPRWYPNMGLPNYIVKDGYFYVYYGDSHDLDAAGKVQNTTVGGGGNPDQGVAVVRARVADVLAAAKQHRATPWMKFYNGSFSEPGMGGGKFTPLNLPPQGYMHGDAAWCEPLKQWVMVQHSGGRVREADRWRKRILITFSSDGLEWSDWQLVYTDHTGSQDVVYPSLMSLDGPSNEVLGQTFAVVFEYRGTGSSSPPFQYSMVNVTVSLGVVVI